MLTKTLFFRKHSDPIVELLLNTTPGPETVLKVFQNSSYLSNPKIQAIIAISLAEAGLQSEEKSNAIAEAAFSAPSHADLQILFLAGWYCLLLRSEKLPIEKLKIIESSISSLISNETLPEIKGSARFIQFNMSAILGDSVTAIQHLYNTTLNVPKQSPYYKKLTLLRSICYLTNGMGTIVDSEIKELLLGDFEKRILQLVKVIDCALTGRITEIEMSSAETEELLNNKFTQHLTPLYFAARYLMTLIQMSNGAFNAKKFSLDNSPNLPLWVNSTQFLIKKNPEKALYLARRFIEEENPFPGLRIPFMSHTLVRAELACGNGKAAKRLLQQLQDLGAVTYFDDFYHARAERLLGNHDAAAAHINKLKASIKQFDARGRFDFEVALACELTPSEILDMSSQSISVTRKLYTDITSRYAENSYTIISASTEMEKIKELILQFAPIQLPVLITGETGTGKELVARALHQHSPQADKRFLAINCAAIPDALIESELFGHASGAFTGANTTYKGIFRDVEGGTVFLDEIGEISPRLQAALLRFIETGEVKPVGSSSYYKVNCRVVAATNKNLFSLAESGAFRNDLFFRLQRLEVHIPTLEERPDDIIPLATHFLNLGREEELATLSEELIIAFKNYSWPGNIRELRNVIDRMRVISSDKLHYQIDDFLSDSHIKKSDIKNTSVGMAISEEDELLLPENSQVKSTQLSNIQQFLAGRKTKLRRKNRLRELFTEVEELTVSEAAELMQVSSHTAMRYLQDLCKEGFIKKVSPTASHKTNYYVKQLFV